MPTLRAETHLALSTPSNGWPSGAGFLARSCCGSTHGTANLGGDMSRPRGRSRKRRPSRPRTSVQTPGSLRCPEDSRSGIKASKPSEPPGETPKPKVPITWKIAISLTAGFSVLFQGLVSLTASRRWQWTWLLGAVAAMIILTYMSQVDPGVLSKKFFSL